MKIKFRKGFTIILLFLCPFVITVQSCKPETIEDIINMVVGTLTQAGWLAEDENMNNIPEDITPLDDDTGTLPASYSLESKFPPIGDQGQYGTCVVWSVGYNMKTALNAIEKGWSPTDLANKANQTSPKDLWLSIPEGSRGANCNGTNFEPAMDALIAGGAASLSDVPYTNLGSCTGTKVGNSGNKLTNYRKIASETEGLTVNNFKNYLASGRPISIGAKLGDRFMSWNSSAVINSETYNNPGMQHAYHAMVLVGYDDSKHAFRVRNSWGPSWGDGGSIWVDYDFFCNSFCFAAFVAQNVGSVSVGSNGVENLSNGEDLLAYSGVDVKVTGDPDYNRKFSYQVYNSGNIDITPDRKWSVLYMYYNAKDANEYGIIYEDYYTNEFGPKDSIGVYPGSDATQGAYWNNIAIKAGKQAGEDYDIFYNLPSSLNGEYYLVVFADGYEKIHEVNEDNNFFFISAEGGKPLQIQNGEILNMPSSAQQIAKKSIKIPAKYSNTTTQTLVKPGNLNTYSPAEIKTMLLHDKQTGKLAIKQKAYRAQGHKGIKVKR